LAGVLCLIAAVAAAVIAGRELRREPEGRASPFATGWSQVTIDHSPEALVPAQSVVLEGDRLVAAGAIGVSCCDLAHEVWTSRDGRRWGRDPHDPRVTLDGLLFTGPAAFARGARRRVAVGTRARDRSDARVTIAAAWFSDDGRAWHRVPDDPAIFGRSAMQQVWPTRTGFVAFGKLYSRAGDTTGLMAWRSRDGHTWSRDAAAAARIPRDRSTGLLELPPMAQTRRGIVAVAAHDSWLSADGRSWQHTATLPASPAAGSWSLFDTGRALFAVRSYLRPSGRADKTQLDVMRSDDGRHFQALGAAFGPPADTEVRTIRKTTSGWLAVVGRYNSSTLWGSRDGRSFKPLTDARSPFANAAVGDITQLDSTIVLVGGVPRHPSNSPAPPIARRPGSTASPHHDFARTCSLRDFGQPPQAGRSAGRRTCWSDPAGASRSRTQRRRRPDPEPPGQGAVHSASETGAAAFRKRQRSPVAAGRAM